jgi:hypothetical protein
VKINNITINNTKIKKGIEMENMSLAESKKSSIIKSIATGTSELFSAVLEEEVSPKQSMLILHSIVAGIVTVFATGMPLWFTCLSIAWFGYSLHLCKKAGLGEEEN